MGSAFRTRTLLAIPSTYLHRKEESGMCRKEKGGVSRKFFAKFRKSIYNLSKVKSTKPFFSLGCFFSIEYTILAGKN